MGQQQIMLVILATVIVGIATAIAVTTFSSSSAATNIDSVRQDLGSLAGDAVTYYNRPDMFNGGGGAFDNITFNHLKFGIDTLNATGTISRNDNGKYVIISASGDELVIIGNPRSDVRGLQDVSSSATTANALRAVITPTGVTISRADGS